MPLAYADVTALRRAYVFDDLQSFLDIYYANCAVLLTEVDFYDLTTAYLSKAVGQGVRHAEIFFDPQTHTRRGVAFETCISGIRRASTTGRQPGVRRASCASCLNWARRRRSTRFGGPTSCST